jgi:hypothetical protein
MKVCRAGYSKRKIFSAYISPEGHLNASLTREVRPGNCSHPLTHEAADTVWIALFFKSHGDFAGVAAGGAYCDFAGGFLFNALEFFAPLYQH